MTKKKLRRILLTGSNGQVGWELQRSLSPIGEIISPKKRDFDLSKPETLRKNIREWKPDMIINPAAYTAVDLAEKESDLAIMINANAPRILAEEAEKLGVPLIHYSTDYVFDGTKKGAYTEDDSPNPLNVYGFSKLKGEQEIKGITDQYLILRISWIYSMRGKNFLTTMLRLFNENNEIKVVNDQFGAPTWSRVIAETTAKIIGTLNGEEKDRWGLYHLTASGKCSWFDFANAILKLILGHSTVKIKPVYSSQYGQNVVRPVNSLLSNDLLISSFGVVQSEWKESLSMCLLKK